MKVCTAYINAFMNRQYGDFFLKWLNLVMGWTWFQYGEKHWLHYAIYTNAALDLTHKGAHPFHWVIIHSIKEIYHFHIPPQNGNILWYSGGQITAQRLMTNEKRGFAQDELTKYQVFGLPWFQLNLIWTGFRRWMYMICLTIIHNCL